MFECDGLVRGDYHVIPLELNGCERAVLAVIHAVTKRVGLNVVFNLFLPVGHHRERDDCTSR